jgi:hypothetical protein
MKTMCAKIQEFERFEEIDRSNAADEKKEGLSEIHHCNDCNRAVVVTDESDLYFTSGLCKFCRDEVYKEMYEGSLEGQLEKICNQLDEILGQTKEINKTLRGEK